MISESMQQLVNRLIQLEFYSAFFYLAQANYFQRSNLTGMAKWLQAQHTEELEHAQKLVDYLNDMGGVVELRGIQEQPGNFGAPLEAWQRVLAHEQFVTQSYQEAYDLALKARDYQTAAILQDFLKEQVDELAQSLHIVGRLQINAGNPAGLLLLDQELGQQAK